ncbi:unnamed protein product [Parajaminaea phylloscopi]
MPEHVPTRDHGRPRPWLLRLEDADARDPPRGAIASVHRALGTTLPIMRVLISGAGVAGPALAWHLAKLRASVTVLERSPEALPHGQNVDIRDSALDVLRGMGVLEKVRGAFTNEVGAQFLAPDGRPVASFPLMKGYATSPTAEFEVMRGDIAAILYDASKEFENVNFRFQTTVQDVLSNDDKSVRVRLSNGEEHEYDLVVAADGQWSPLRRKVFRADSVKVVDKNLFFAYWTVPRGEQDDNWWKLYTGLKRRVMMLRPDPHGTVRALVGKMPEPGAEREEWDRAYKQGREVQQDLVRRQFKDIGWEAERLLGAMKDAPDWYFHGIQQIKMDKWSNSRVVCLGDAACAPTALTGRGTSLALLGAYRLAGELSKLQPGQHPRAAFEAYEEGFKPHVESVQDLPSFIPGLMYPRGRLHRWCLQTFVATFSKLVRIPFILRRLRVDESKAETLPQYEAFQPRTVSAGKLD